MKSKSEDDESTFSKSKKENFANVINKSIKLKQDKIERKQKEIDKLV